MRTWRVPFSGYVDVFEDEDEVHSAEETGDCVNTMLGDICCSLAIEDEDMRIIEEKP